ncbi:MAG: cysteine peptidase family C39 domain-containing protein [bacterium]
MKIELSCLPQETENSCLPACIRIVLRYLGYDFAESEIRTACETTHSGTGHEQAAAGIFRLGFNATKLENAPLGMIDKFLRQSKPVIALLHVSHLPYTRQQTGLHAVVVNGSENDYISFIDPARGEEIEIDLDTFLAAWDERGRLGLVIESEPMKDVAT